MTDKNTLNTWFTTGSKPTQEQFWAWQDSYWHKNDSIPQSSVQGLEKALSLKAEAQAVAGLAKKDATNLRDADVDAWKTKLGVGTLPPNIATYDPAKANYVMMKDGTDRPAGDLGKNVANASLTSLRGAGLTLGDNWSLSTRGYSYYIEGLPDKSNDATYNKMLVQESTGKVALSDGAPILKKQGAVLPDVSNDGSYSRILVSNPNGDTGLGDATNIVAALQTATQAEINTLFNIMGGNYVGMTSPVVNSISPPIIPYLANTTQKIALYGAGLNLLNDPILSKVEIIDTSTNQTYQVGFNSLGSGVLEIFIPYHFVSAGKTYKVGLTNGLQHYQSILSFDVVDPAGFSKVVINDAKWVYSELTAGQEAKNGRLIINNGFLTAPQRPQSPNVLTYQKEGVFYYDLSDFISPTDNFFVEFTIANKNMYYNNSDFIGVGFLEKSSFEVSDIFSSSLKYGGVSNGGIAIINPSASVLDGRQNVIANFTVMRKHGIVSTSCNIITGGSSSVAVSMVPIQIIQQLKLAVWYKFYNWDSQVQIKNIIKW